MKTLSHAAHHGAAISSAKSDVRSAPRAKALRLWDGGRVVAVADRASELMLAGRVSHGATIPLECGAEYVYREDARAFVFVPKEEEDE